MYVGHTNSRALCAQLNELGWGEMDQPRELPPRRFPFALDNYAFASWKNNKPWDAESFKRGVELCYRKKFKPDFVVVPDIVAGGQQSLEQSITWVPWLRGFAPLYLAVQDGMCLDLISSYLHLFDGLFVGGTKDWKLASGFWWVSLAHGAQKPCHVGRISGRRDVRLVKSWGTDSIDSCVPLWSQENLQAVVKGLADPPIDFDPGHVEHFLTASAVA